MGLRQWVNKIKIPYLGILSLPALIYFTGIAINAIVMATNGGQMPVQWPGGCSQMTADEYHICMSAATNLNWLSDWIVLPFGVASPADISIWLGDIMWHPFLYGWLALILRDAWVRRR